MKISHPIIPLWRVERVFNAILVTGCVLIALSAIIGLTAIALNSAMGQPGQ